MSSDPVKIVIVQSSLHAKSTTAAMCRFVESQAAQLGAHVTFIDLRELDLPIFNPQTGRDSDAYKQIADTVAHADAFILGTPDYHGGPAAGTKNFLDYFWKEFTGKLFGYICASHEKGLTTMDTLRTAVRQCYGWSLPYGVSGMEKIEVEPEGDILDEKLKDRLTMLAHDTVRFARILADARNQDLQSTTPSFLAALRS
jgi:NAD(P)H-dependent FMN reductase